MLHWNHATATRLTGNYINLALSPSEIMGFVTGGGDTVEYDTKHTDVNIKTVCMCGCVAPKYFLLTEQQHILTK